MSIDGSFPSASIYSTWVESVEVRSVEDDGFADFDDVTEITLLLRDRRSGFNELTLTMGDGSITVPSDGVIQWRVEREVMGTLPSQLYEIILLIDVNGDRVDLWLGNVSIVE